MKKLINKNYMDEQQKRDRMFIIACFGSPMILPLDPIERREYLGAISYPKKK
jgi:hypothetical protein